VAVSGPSIAELIERMKDAAPSTADVDGDAGTPRTADVLAASQWDVVKFMVDHGRPPKVSKAEFVTWWYRLDVERGRLRRYKVGADPLPPDAHPNLRTSYDGFVYLLGCRWLHTPFQPAPWTHPFAEAWCGLPARLAKDARRELVKMGALIEAGRWGRFKLWLPWGVDSIDASPDDQRHPA
jgi:hypothetical protein